MSSAATSVRAIPNAEPRGSARPRAPAPDVSPLRSTRRPSTMGCRRARSWEGSDDAVACVGSGDQRRRGTSDAGVRPTGSGAVLLGAWFAPATTYELVWDERLYPPKAILGTVYEFATGRRLASGDFEGGKSGAVRVLEKLGIRRPAPVTTRVSGSPTSRLTVHDRRRSAGSAGGSIAGAPPHRRRSSSGKTPCRATAIASSGACGTGRRGGSPSAAGRCGPSPAGRAAV
jgi:hypothetical protein